MAEKIEDGDALPFTENVIGNKTAQVIELEKKLEESDKWNGGVSPEW